MVGFTFSCVATVGVSVTRATEVLSYRLDIFHANLPVDFFRPITGILFATQQ